MYSLNCDYFVEEFSSIEELINYVEQVKMDPSYEITLNGKGTGEYASDLVSFCEDDGWKMDRKKQDYKNNCIQL